MFCVCLVLMAHTHCIGPGRGQGLGPRMMHLLYTLRRDRTRDREWDQGLMGSITYFPVPVPVPFPCSALGITTKHLE